LQNAFEDKINNNSHDSRTNYYENCERFEGKYMTNTNKLTDNQRHFVHAKNFSYYETINNKKNNTETKI